MDIYSFINSKDIAEYLKSLNYEFTLPEAAFIVYQSRYRTMEEKFETWQKLINIMPDCSMDERLNMKPIESFHQFLRDYMELQEKVLQLFYDASGALYTYVLYERCGWRTWKDHTEFRDETIHQVELGEYFADAESAVSHFKLNREDYEQDGVERVAFIKRPLLKQPDFEREEYIRLEMTPSMDVLSINAEYGTIDNEDFTLQEQFEGMWFSFPTPFVRGDLLIDRTYHRNYFDGPFVLDSLVTWDSDTLLKNGFSEQSSMVKQRGETIKRLLGSADSSDMDYYGIFLDSDGMGFPAICSDVFWSYLNLEYYDEPLQGMYRVLKPVSSAMKINPETGEPLIGQSLLCNAYQLLVNEQMVRLNRQFLEAWYTGGGQELAGLKKVADGETEYID